MRNKPYTQSEDIFIMECIKNNPNNLSKAFDIAANKLKIRTPSALSLRYYKVLRKQTPLIAIGSPKTILINTKNTLRTTPNSLYNAKMRTDMLKSAFLCIAKEKIIDYFISKLSSEEQSTLLSNIVSKINKDNK